MLTEMPDLPATIDRGLRVIQMMMKRVSAGVLAITLGIAAATTASTIAGAQTEQPERIIVPMHFNQFIDGGFWWKTAGTLGTDEGRSAILAACEVLAVDCAADVDAVAEIARGITEEATVGIAIRGFVSAPEGYQICRALPVTPFLQRVVNGGFLAQIIRSDLEDGIAYAVNIPRGRQLGDRFIDFTAAFEFIAETADLEAYQCWPSFEYAWSCDGNACGFYRQRRNLDLTDFVEADGITTDGEAATAWETPVIESGPGGGTVVYEFTATAPGYYRLEFDYASAEERPVAITFNGNVVNEAGLRRANQDDWQPRPLVNAFVPMGAEPRWAYEGLVEVTPGLNRLELAGDGPFPLIMQIRLEPR